MLRVLVIQLVLLAREGSGRFRITPADVPIHSRLRHTISDVTRRHAVLC